MVMKKMAQIEWEKVIERLKSQGVNITSDINPTTTASGYRDEGRFSFCWLEGTQTATLEIEKISMSCPPGEDPFVKVISESLLKSGPFCVYKNENRRGLLIFEWRLLEYQEERIKILMGMKSVTDLIRL